MADLGCSLTGRSWAVEYLGEAEIENLGVLVAGDEDIGRLDVAMNDALTVRGLQAFGDFDRERQQASLRPWDGRQCDASVLRRPEIPWQ